MSSITSSTGPLSRLSAPAAYGVAGVRFAISLGFAAAPEQTMQALFGTPVKTRTTRAIAAQYAVRDLVLGLGLVAALRRGRGARAWMLAGTIADVVDGAAVAATADRKSRGRQRLLLAQMAVVVATDVLITATVEPDGLRLPDGP